MKIEAIKKFRIIDKEYLPDNVTEIRVEQDSDNEDITITYVYDRDGQIRVERYSKNKLKLFSSIFEELI